MSGELKAKAEGFPPETVMTQEQLASALSTSVDSLVRAGVPASYALGPKQPRYIWKRVIEFMERAS